MESGIFEPYAGNGENVAHGQIYGINGPVIRVRGSNRFRMMDTVLAGHEKLIGEVIRIEREEAIIQVYEYTTGLKPGEPVASTGKPLSVMLAPGIMGNVFDGIQRPLAEVEKTSGTFIKRGMAVSQLDKKKRWFAEILVRVGDIVTPGKIIARVKETDAVDHFIMVPPDVSGKVINVVPDGEYTITDTICTVKTENAVKDLAMLQE